MARPALLALPVAHELPELEDAVTSRIPLRRLLAVHDQHRAGEGLADYLCDGYMLAHNRVLRNARRHVVSAGFRLSSSELSESHGWKLMSLAYLIEKKVIPYHDTVALLRDLEHRHPRHFTLRDLVRVSRPGRSGILHESMHVIADAIVREERRRCGLADDADEQSDRLFEILLGESLVAAAEGFASYYGRGQMQTFLLWGYHSQVWLLRTVRAALREVIESFGLHAAFELWTMGFLHYNFLYERVDASDVHHSLRALGIDQRPTTRDTRNILVLMRDALRMNPVARTQVTFNYQYFMRLSEARTMQEYVRAIDFDFRDTHVSRAAYRQTIARVAATALAP